MTATIKQFPVERTRTPEVAPTLTVSVRCGDDTMLDLPIDHDSVGLWPAPCEAAIVRAALVNALIAFDLAFT